MKVTELKDHMFEIYSHQVFKEVDFDNLVKEQIESKGIVVIDELDKIVK